MNAPQTQHTVNQFLQFLTTRDLTALTHLFSENIDWYIPGDEEKAAWLGKRNTRQQVKEFYELLWSNTEPLSAQIDHILIDDKIAVITGAFSTRMLSTNNTVTSLFCIQLTVENDVIVKYRLLEDSHAVSIAMTTTANSTAI